MSDDAALSVWAADPPTPAVRESLERLRRAPDVVRVAAMPDAHLAAGVCNGVVVGTRRLIYPAAVGGDIGCGYAAVAFDGDADVLERRRTAEEVLDQLPTAVPIIRRRRRDGLPELASVLDPARLSDECLSALAASEGRLELGTLGRGNHFLEFQQADDGRLWLMTHSGSRAMGQHIAAFHLQRATSAGGGLAWLDAESEAGQAYLADAAWARAYAAESRRLLLEAAAAIAVETLGRVADWSTLLNCDHNHVQAEQHDGATLWVHRKGANRADVDLPAIIAGSMATSTYHVAGRGVADALASSSHGAGRRLSRGAARAKIRRNDLVRQLADVWIDPRVATRLTDEAPTAYRDIDAVMRAQRDLTRITRRLRPVLCYKGA